MALGSNQTTRSEQESCQHRTSLRPHKLNLDEATEHNILMIIQNMTFLVWCELLLNVLKLVDSTGRTELYAAPKTSNTAQVPGVGLCLNIWIISLWQNRQKQKQSVWWLVHFYVPTTCYQLPKQSKDWETAIINRHTASTCDFWWGPACMSFIFLKTSP